MDAITRPARLWTAAEVRARPSPVPARAGVYGWYFRTVPCSADTSGCVRWNGLPLLYIGISPSAPPANGRTPSKGTLRTRIRAHYGGNASASTLRFTLGVLLGIPLIQQPTGRLTFGETGERELSDWMAENALVTWAPVDRPWIAEEVLIGSLDLPLNLKGNSRHPFRPILAAIRHQARLQVRDCEGGVP